MYLHTCIHILYMAKGYTCIKAFLIRSGFHLLLSSETPAVRSSRERVASLLFVLLVIGVYSAVVVVVLGYLFMKELKYVM